jgi:hypothetical protein
VPHPGTTYYLAPAANGGKDSNNGLSPSTPWLTPNHSVNCGDTILAASGTYSYTNFQPSDWGSVFCPGNNNVAWLKCATFDTCKISVTATNQSAIKISSSYWGVQGWEVTTSSTSNACFQVIGDEGTPAGNVHHIIFANDIANGCAGGGFLSSPIGSIGVDYFVVVGSIAYNAAQGSTNCYEGIASYEPVASDALPGTHYYYGGNFAFDNVEPALCAGEASTDGEGLFFDTFDGSGTSQAAYTQQGVIDNNIAVFNGGGGVMSGNNTVGATHATIYLRHNTTYGNEDSANRHSNPNCAEIPLDKSLNTEVFANLDQVTASTGCNGNTLYLYYVSNGNGTDNIYNNYGYNSDEANTGSANSTGFSFGPNNTLTTSPAFANPTNPGAPSCGSYSSVPACMAAVIANFTPTNPTAMGYGYQIPSSTPVYDPLFPQWLCSVTNLPAGLVTMGCQTSP